MMIIKGDNMIQCSHKEETINQDGSWTCSTCINKAEILIASDPCYGLCYRCAYNKMKAENKTKNKEIKRLHKNNLDLFE